MNKRKRIKSKVSELLNKIEAKNKGIEITIVTGDTGWALLKDFKKSQKTGNFNKGKKR